MMGIQEHTQIKKKIIVDIGFFSSGISLLIYYHMLHMLVHSKSLLNKLSFKVGAFDLLIGLFKKIVFHFWEITFTSVWSIYASSLLA